MQMMLKASELYGKRRPGKKIFLLVVTEDMVVPVLAWHLIDEGGNDTEESMKAALKSAPDPSGVIAEILEKPWDDVFLKMIVARRR